jgi:hypothetical protein
VERIWFDQSMAGYSPVVTLTANDSTQQQALNNTLTFDSGWSWWVSGTTFRAGFDVADSGVLGSAAGITIHVKWARAGTTYPYYDQARYSGPANFNFDTISPVSLGSLAASPSAASLTDAVLSSGVLNLSVGTFATSTDNQQSAINPIDQAVALTGTWLDI